MYSKAIFAAMVMTVFSSAEAGAAAPTLGGALSGAASVHVTQTNFSVGTNMQSDVTSPAEVAAILAAIGPEQTPTDAMPRCLTPYRLDFLAPNGRPLGSVGLCDSPGLADSSKSAARFDGSCMRTRGLVVLHLADLRAALRPHGFVLP
jgi:hypothetical protein